jgi:hypothetical protein
MNDTPPLSGDDSARACARSKTATALDSTSLDASMEDAVSGADVDATTEVLTEEAGQRVDHPDRHVDQAGYVEWTVGRRLRGVVGWFNYLRTDWTAHYAAAALGRIRDRSRRYLSHLARKWAARLEFALQWIRRTIEIVAGKGN